jgi:membrane protein
MRVRFKMPRLWKLHGLTIKTLAARVWHEMFEDDVLGVSAKLSFYMLLALFPVLIVITTVFGFFAQSDQLRTALLDYFRHVVPRSAFHLVQNTLNQITEGAGGGKLSLGLIATLFAASSGIGAVIEGLNSAYEVKDERPWWKVRLTALWLTVGFTVFTVVALLLIMLGPKLGEILVSHVGHASLMNWLWNVGRWPVAFLIVMLAFTLLYRYAPDLKSWHLPFFTPGALVGVLLWILVSWGFRTYLRFFNSYNATYGSLGAVVILMLWLYLTGAALLVGAEVNSEIEKAAAESGDPNARLPGERAPGEKRRAKGWPHRRKSREKERPHLPQPQESREREGADRSR